MSNKNGARCSSEFRVETQNRPGASWLLGALARRLARERDTPRLHVIPRK